MTELWSDADEDELLQADFATGTRWPLASNMSVNSDCIQKEVNPCGVLLDTQAQSDTLADMPIQYGANVEDESTPRHVTGDKPHKFVSMQCDVPLDLQRKTDTMPRYLPRQVAKPVQSNSPIDMPALSDAPIDVPKETDDPLDLPVQTDIPEQTDATMDIPEHTDALEDIPEQTDLPLDLTDGPIDIREQTDVPTDIPEQTDVPVDIYKQSDAPSDIPEQAGAPVDISAQTDAPIDMHEQTVAPIDVPERTDLPEDIPVQTGAPVDIHEQHDAFVDIPAQGDAPIDMHEQTDAHIDVLEQIDAPIGIPIETTDCYGRRGVSSLMDSDSDFDSSDNELLATLRSRKGLLPYNDPASSGEEYGPEKTALDSSDSEFYSSSDSSNEPLVKKRNVLKLKTKKSHDKASLDTPKAATVSAASNKGGQVQNYSVQMRQIHESRLLKLVQSNGYIIQQVPRDGDCFFTASALHLSGSMTAAQLRKQLCDHLEERMNDYIDFFPMKEDSNLEKWQDYLVEVEKLRAAGYFSNRVADFLPLSLANWSGKCVRIFCSKASIPVIDITPTTQGNENEKRIILAYTSITGLPDHYDACTTPALPSTSATNICQDSAARTSASATSHVTSFANPDDSNTIPGTLNSESDVVATSQCSSPNDADIPTPTHNIPKSPTRRMSAAFNTPPKKKLFRKRRSTPETWIKNKRKHLRLSGKEYVNQEGKTMRARSVQAVDCSKCRYKCSANISEETRQSIFKNFWNLSSYTRQKDFICSNTTEKKTRTYLDEEENVVQKKRQVHRTYTFQLDGERHNVCKTFFRKTLDVGESYINHALLNKNQGIFAGTENRGHHKPHNKTPTGTLRLVREHIESFPTVDAHYTRRDTNRKFLGSTLNIKKMYELYKDKCTSDATKAVSSSLYRKVFTEEFNYSFHVPKKDQCSLCQRYYREKESGSVQQELEHEYTQHQERKMRAREEKIKDKALALKDKSIFVATFDLEAVLYTPCSLVSELFYMRKLNCYNFTVYNLATKGGTCFVWSEVDAQRGSCEVASCLQIQLKALPPTVKHVVLYSDTCSGQNRNQHVAASLLHAVTTIEHISTIDHKFLEPGHTQMECDAIHSTIEFAKKKTSIYVPSQWDTVIRMARRKDPYIVIPIQYTDVMDFKKYAHGRLRNTKIDTDGGRVNWLSMCWMRYIKGNPESVFFKTEHSNESFRELKVSTGSRRGRPQSICGPLTRRYSGKQAISSAKKKDLMSLCRSGIIPREYHNYYKELPTDADKVECLPLPDAIEQDTDTDTD